MSNDLRARLLAYEHSLKEDIAAIRRVLQLLERDSGSVKKRQCADARLELQAVEYFEMLRWNGTPMCASCSSPNVYQMMDDATGRRNTRFLWRCRDCHRQFTVRIGTILEESRVPLRHWKHAIKAVARRMSAAQVSRDCELSYKSALRLVHTIRKNESKLLAHGE